MKNLQNNLYQDRIVLITGTTKGIGLHLAKHFLEQEAIVCGFARSESSSTQSILSLSRRCD
jgi:3-oxoacyl-[acyl-carrier protein] reductase